MQVEPRLAGGNAEVEGPIDHSLAPFKAATKLPFLAAGGELLLLPWNSRAGPGFEPAL
jgi:hypothetical protein